MTDKRKHQRVKVRVVASFDCYNEDGELFNQKLGIILDISLGGMLIETDDVIEANYVEIVFVNHEHELMSIVGSIVHSKKCENGKAKTGLCFHGADSENVKIATNLIRTHYFGNKESSLKRYNTYRYPKVNNLIDSIESKAAEQTADLKKNE